MTELTKKEISRILLEEVYPRLTEETVEALALVESERDNEWVFYMGLFLFLTALQCREGGIQAGAMLQVEKFVTLSGIEWGSFKTAASMAIKQSDPRLKALGAEQGE